MSSVPPFSTSDSESLFKLIHYTAYAKSILLYLGIMWIEETTMLYRVQVGAFAEKANADKLRDRLRQQGYAAVVV